jgi:hypothetical protein
MSSGLSEIGYAGKEKGDRLREKRGINVIITTMHRASQKLGLRHKKV